MPDPKATLDAIKNVAIEFWGLMPGTASGALGRHLPPTQILDYWKKAKGILVELEACRLSVAEAMALLDQTAHETWSHYGGFPLLTISGEIAHHKYVTKVASLFGELKEKTS